MAALLNTFKFNELKDETEASSIVKKTWKELMKNEQAVGEKIYENVLTKEISMSVLFINSQIERQSISFMGMLDTVIGYLDNPKTLRERLLELGEIHANQHRVKPKHYKHFRAAFMKGVKTFIPWNDRREEAWLWFWDLVITTMLTSFKRNSQIFSLDTPQEKISEYTLAIQESFAIAMESPVEFGTSFYSELLKQQNDVANLFSKTKFKDQSARFIAMLQHAVRLLDDQSTFQNKILTLSYQHHQYGVKINQLQGFANVFVDTLKIANANKWKPIHDESWNWFWSVIIKLFKIGLEEKQSNDDKNQLFLSDNQTNSNDDYDYDYDYQNDKEL